MLERVALNQTRFFAPGLAPDARGVALGPKLGLLFSSIDRLVAFFRIYSEQASLDELLPSLHIWRVRTPVAAHELLVVFAAESSYRADRAARAARLCGGLSFTGAGKHFVQYRDEASPLGYDTAEISAAEADVVLYGRDFTQAYGRVEELLLSQLVFRLELIRQAGPPDVEDVEFLYLGAERGLGQALVRYLWRNRVRCEATLCEPPEGSAFQTARALWVLRVQSLPERMLRLFLATPGVEVYRPLGENVALEIGYRHPIHLESCSQIFERGKFYLFSGRRRLAEVLAGPLELVSGESFVALHFELGDDLRAKSEARPHKPSALEVPVRLRPSLAPPRRVTAALVPWAQAAWLKKLVYTLPPTLLRGHRIAALADEIVLCADGALDLVPLGMPMQEVAVGLYLPVGFEFSPRTSPEVLAQHTGAGPERLVFFRPGHERPLQVETQALLPLERRTLAGIAVETARIDARLEPPGERGEPELRSAKVGPFALWGFRGDSDS